MKKLFTFAIFFTFTTLVSFAQKHADLYRGGVFYKSYPLFYDALWHANPVGDSIVLSADTFFETYLNGSMKDVKYQGTISGGDTTTIDGGGKFEYMLVTSEKGSLRDIIFQNSQGVMLGTHGRSFFINDTFIIGGHSIFRNCVDTVIHYPYGDHGPITCGTSQIIIEENVQIVDNNTREGIWAWKLLLKDNVLIARNRVNGRGNYYTSSSYDSLNDYGFLNVYSGIQLHDSVKIINNTADSIATAGVCIYNRVPDTSFFIGDDVVISNNISYASNSKGGAILINKLYSTSGTLPGVKILNFGKTVFEHNESNRGGVIYCEDSSYKLVFKGTQFRNNKATSGGAIYTRGSLDIKDANFTDNEADSGASIFINTKVGPTTSFLTVSTSRFYNRLLPADKQNHIFATYTPLTALAPSINLNGNWWGKSDTIGVLRENPKGLSNLGYWAVANWSVKGGTAVVAGDTSFPVAAEIKYNHGIAFPASSFSMLEGIYSTDTGKFVPTVSPINSSNIVSSTFHTYKDSAVTSVSANFVASIDADTFRKTQIIWSKDTLTTTGNIANKSLPNISVYPNPVADMLHIANVPKGSIVGICDLQGRGVLRSDNLYDLYVGHLAAGTYIVSVLLPDGSVGTAKIIKK